MARESGPVLDSLSSSSLRAASARGGVVRDPFRGGGVPPFFAAKGEEGRPGECSPLPFIAWEISMIYAMIIEDHNRASLTWGWRE